MAKAVNKKELAGANNNQQLQQKIRPQQLNNNSMNKANQKMENSKPNVTVENQKTGEGGSVANVAEDQEEACSCCLIM